MSLHCRYKLSKYKCMYTNITLYGLLRLYFLHLFTLIYLKISKISSKAEVECFRSSLNTIKKLLMVFLRSTKPQARCVYDECVDRTAQQAAS